MNVVVPKEIAPGEARVAVVPESIKRMVAKHGAVTLEAGAGAASLAPDAEYAAAGAAVEPDLAKLHAGADVVLKIRPPSLDEIAGYRDGSTLVSLLYPLSDLERVRALAKKGMTA